MPVRQLSKPSSAASAEQQQVDDDVDGAGADDGRRIVAGASGSSTTISMSEVAIGLVVDGRRAACHASATGATAQRRDAAYFATKPASVIRLLVELVVLLEELQHVLAGEEDRLQRLLLHVVLVFGGLRHLLEQVDVERRLLRRHLAGQEHGAQHQVLHVEALLLAGRDVVPGLRVGDLGLVGDALLVEHAERAHLAGAPDFEVLRRIVDVGLRCGCRPAGSPPRRRTCRAGRGTSRRSSSP